MARNEKKRAKKLEKKRKERKQKLVQAARVKSGGLAVQLALAGSWPLYKALRAEIDKESGLEDFIVIRRSKEGVFAFACFFIDRECLGVKDTFAKMFPADQFADYEEKVINSGRFELKPISLAYIRKCCEESIAFARKFGIEPHADYSKTSLIFADVDASTCTAEFEFGVDGKPFYIPGPGESYARQMQIIELVQRAGGQFTMPVDGVSSRLSGFSLGENGEFVDDEFDDEFEDEYEDERGNTYDGDFDKEDEPKPVVLETTFQQHNQ